MGCASARPSRKRDGAAGNPRGDTKEKSPGPRDEGFWGEGTASGLTLNGQGNKYMTMSPIAATRTDQVAKTMN
jgi:hypothetical protein